MKLEKFKEKDKKKIGIIIFTVSCVFLIAGVFLYKTFALFEAKDSLNIIEGQVQGVGDLYFAFYVDDVVSQTMPGKDDEYVLDSNKSTCNNGATPELNQEDWSIKVKNMTQSRTKCTLYFKEQTFADAVLACNDTAANCLVNNSSLDTINLAYDNTVDNNLRYIGANPNNYVLFNNELWRIIGVMNNVSDDTGNTAPKLKIIRNEYYKEMSWDTKNPFGVNDWSTATSQIELNTTYYNTLIDKGKIANIKWKLGGSNTEDVTSNMFYERERGTTVYNGHATEWTGRIGLMYPSDYVYATSGGATLNREACLASKPYYWNHPGYSDCFTNDWLYDASNIQWTLTPDSSTIESVVRVATSGFVGGDYAINSILVVSPTLYLKSEVTIVGGSGTESVPYQLG